MKIKQGVRYFMYDQTRAVGTFFLVILVIMVASMIIGRVTKVDISSNGTDVAGFIFLFVLGLNAYKPQLRLFVQSGLSRRTLWISALVMALAVSLVTTLMKLVFALIFGRSVGVAMVYSILYEFFGMNSAGISLVGVVWTVMASLSMLLFGFCISTLYYRMSKALKIVVSIGVPVLFFVVMPIAELLIDWFDGFTAFWRAIIWAMGLSLGTTFPLRAIGSMAVFSVVMAGLSYLLVRRAPLRES